MNAQTLKHRRKNNKLKHGKKTLEFNKLAQKTSKNKKNLLDSNSLVKMKNEWNKRTDDKITPTDERGIWMSLKDKMDTVCSNEQCWLKQKFMENNLSPELTTTFV